MIASRECVFIPLNSAHFCDLPSDSFVFYHGDRFFKGENANSLDSVQWHVMLGLTVYFQQAIDSLNFIHRVYLGVAALGLCLNILF